MNFQDRWTY